MVVSLFRASFDPIRAPVSPTTFVLAIYVCSRLIRMADSGTFIAIFFTTLPVLTASLPVSVFAFLVIVEAPETDVIVPLNATGVFVCKAEIGDKGLSWQVQFPGALNPTPLDFLEDQFDARGIVVTTTNDTTTLAISGLLENNNTDLYCVIFGGETSLQVSFFVFGK